MNLEIPILSLIIWLPIVCGAILLLMARSKSLIVRYAPLLVSCLSLGLIAYALQGFALNTALMQFAEHKAWMPTLGIEYGLGVDGFAILLVALTIFMTLLVLIAALSHVEKSEYIKYCATFLVMQGLMCGVFLATDAVLFYVFFEAMMIPMFLIIEIWGAENRIYATFKVHSLHFVWFVIFASIYIILTRFSNPKHRFYRC